MTKEDIIQELRDASESIDGIYYSNFIELNFAEFMVSKIFDNINNRSCESCSHCSKVFTDSYRCDLFECYQQKRLGYCKNWESKDE